jgi:hypothetical protein
VTAKPVERAGHIDPARAYGHSCVSNQGRAECAPKWARHLGCHLKSGVEAGIQRRTDEDGFGRGAGRAVAPGNRLFNVPINRPTI